MVSMTNFREHRLSHHFFIFLSSFLARIHDSSCRGLGVEESCESAYWCQWGNLIVQNGRRINDASEIGHRVFCSVNARPPKKQSVLRRSAAVARVSVEAVCRVRCAKGALGVKIYLWTQLLRWISRYKRSLCVYMNTHTHTVGVCVERITDKFQFLRRPEFTSFYISCEREQVSFVFGQALTTCHRSAAASGRVILFLFSPSLASTSFQLPRRSLGLPLPALFQVPVFYHYLCILAHFNTHLSHTLPSNRFLRSCVVVA